MFFSVRDYNKHKYREHLVLKVYYVNTVEDRSFDMLFFREWITKYRAMKKKKLILTEITNIMCVHGEIEI